MAGQVREFFLRLKALILKGRMEREMEQELAFHEEMLKAKLRREGANEAQAAAAIHVRFGDRRRWHERLRELWQFHGLENLGRDLKFAVRVLSKSPGFTCVALVTLALGIGANTTVFSMINGLLLRPLAVPESDRLTALAIDQGRPQVNYSFNAPFFRNLEHAGGALQEVMAYSHRNFQVRSGSGTEEVGGQYVSGDFFSLLRTPPLLGRELTEEDDRPGGNPSGFGAVISESFWQTRFNRVPDVIGRKLTIDNTVFTVVGVMPKTFIGADPMDRPQLFLPLATEEVLNGEQSMIKAGYHGWWLGVMGRLAPGATVEQASAQLAAATDRVLRESVPDASWIADHEKHHMHFIAMPGSTGFSYIRMMFSKPLEVVFGMCVGILLLACLNLASLLFARGAGRQKELATRLAMGGTRRRLVQQLVVEGLLLGMGGTAAGLAIAPAVSRALVVVLLGGQRDMYLDTRLDGRVFGFAAAVALLATLVFALAPAIQATSRNLIERIKDGTHATLADERRSILPRVLLAVEVGLALMLVVGAGLLSSSLRRLYRSGEGFDPRGVENLSFSMDKAGFKGDALIAFYQQMGDRLRHQPGVKTVSFARIVPLTGYVWDDSFTGPTGASEDMHQNAVAPEYFRTMGIPLMEGRDFTWKDANPNAKPIILNRAAVKALMPDGHALGRTVKTTDGKTESVFTVVGVVGDAKYEELRTPAPPTTYQPMTTDDEHSPSFNAVVKAEGGSGGLAAAARAITAQMAPSVPAPVMTGMQEVVDQSLGAERMMTMLAMFFAACALVVTAVGLYGTLAYSTARRTSEIGIRMALGARRGQVVRMVFGQNLAVMMAGTATGLVGALLASKALASFLYGTSARDPWVIAVSIAALAMIACAASLLPAVKAALIEPMQAIRCE
jgi:predicted permease